MKDLSLAISLRPSALAVNSWVRYTLFDAVLLLSLRHDIPHLGSVF